MKNQFLFLLLLLSTFSSAQIIQDWDLSPLGQRTYFERDNGFLEMYYNDSTEVFADYRKHYFGEKYYKEALHGCYDSIQNFFTQINSSLEEYFVEEEWYSNDKFYYILNQNDTIKFYHKAPHGFTWKIPVIHDNFNEIKFECIQITEQDVFGTLDSVRVLQITTFQNNSPVNSSIDLRFIYLSKKHGLLNFTPFYHWVKGNISWTFEEQFNISGFEKNNVVSGLIPEFDLLFESYKVGDIYKWYSHSPVNIPDPIFYKSWVRDSITDISFFSDSILILTSNRQWKFISNESGSVDTIFETIDEHVRTFSKNSFKGLFQVAPRYLFGSNFADPSFINPGHIWKLESIRKDENDKLQFNLNTWDWYNFDFCQDYNYPSDEWRNQTYLSDFGLVYSYRGGAFSDDESQLIGHQRDGIIEGDIAPLCLITSNNNTLTNEKESIQIFPNPATDHLNFIFSKNQNSPFSISIFDAVGKLVLEKRNVPSNSIDVSKLIKGFYFLKISSSFGDSIHKIVKQ